MTCTACNDATIVLDGLTKEGFEFRPCEHCAPLAIRSLHHRRELAESIPKMVGRFRRIARAMESAAKGEQK